MSSDDMRAERATGGIDHSSKARGLRDEPMVQVCIGCGIGSPAVATNYTVITSRYGWRLTQREQDTAAAQQASGVVEWRCPQCWAQHTR